MAKRNLRLDEVRRNSVRGKRGKVGYLSHALVHRGGRKEGRQKNESTSSISGERKGEGGDLTIGDITKKRKKGKIQRREKIALTFAPIGSGLEGGGRMLHSPFSRVPSSGGREKKTREKKEKC